MPTPVVYPFDPNAELESNFILQERHTLSSVNAAPYRIIIPDFAPFYVNDFSATYVSLSGIPEPLIEGVHYYMALNYVGASRSTNKSVYGGIPIITSFANGYIDISYRVVGGPWCADVDHVYRMLLETVYNPRMTWWDNLTNVQEVFPPTPHQQPVDDVSGLTDMLGSLDGIRQAILQAPGEAPASYVAHLVSKGNVHDMTLGDLGCQEAATLAIATDVEVLERQRIDKAVTLRQILLLLGL